MMKKIILTLSFILTFNVFADELLVPEIKNMILVSNVNFGMKALEIKTAEGSDEMEIFINAAVLLYGESNPFSVGDLFPKEEKLEGLHVKLQKNLCEVEESTIKRAQILYCRLKNVEVQGVKRATHHSVPYEFTNSFVTFKNLRIVVFEITEKRVNQVASRLKTLINGDFVNSKGEKKYLSLGKDSLGPQVVFSDL